MHWSGYVYVHQSKNPEHHIILKSYIVLASSPDSYTCDILFTHAITTTSNKESLSKIIK